MPLPWQDPHATTPGGPQASARPGRRPTATLRRSYQSGRRWTFTRRRSPDTAYLRPEPILEREVRSGDALHGKGRTGAFSGDDEQRVPVRHAPARLRRHRDRPRNGETLGRAESPWEPPGCSTGHRRRSPRGRPASQPTGAGCEFRDVHRSAGLRPAPMDAGRSRIFRGAVYHNRRRASNPDASFLRPLSIPTGGVPDRQRRCNDHDSRKRAGEVEREAEAGRSAATASAVSRAVSGRC